MLVLNTISMSKMKLMFLAAGLLSIFCACKHSEMIEKSWSHYENHDTYVEICDLSKVPPYSDYFNKTIYLQREDTLCAIEPVSNLGFKFYIAGTSGDKKYAAFTQIDSRLKKGVPVRIIKIFSGYLINIFHDKTREASGNNSLIAKVELEIPKWLVEDCGLKSSKIIANYEWLSENDELGFNPYIRRAPWEPDSVPEKRYAGILGNEVGAAMPDR